MSRRLRSGEAIATDVPSGARRARGQEADEVGHVAAAHEQPPAVGGIANELGDPSDGLRFDLGRRRREGPRADVRVHGRREEVAKDPDGRRRRRDVAEEPADAR